jgi:hypothetical protein
MVWIELPLEPRHLGVPSDVSKMISEPVVCSAQTVHLSCLKISTISNELTQASTWASSSRSTTIRCVQNDFWAYGMFSTNRAPILNQHQHYLQMDQNEIPHDPRHLEVLSGAPKWFMWMWYIQHKPCTYLALTLTLSPNGPKWDSTWPTSPWSSIGCVKNDF